jgi:hypothetical protein
MSVRRHAHVLAAAVVASAFVLQSSPAEACSTAQPGVHLPPTTSELGEIPSDGALMSTAVLVDVTPEDAPEYVSLKVRE